MNEWIKTWRGGEFLILRSDMKTCILKQPSHLLFIYLFIIPLKTSARRTTAWSADEVQRNREQHPFNPSITGAAACLCVWMSQRRTRSGEREEKQSSEAVNLLPSVQCEYRMQLLDIKVKLPFCFPQPSRSDDQLHQLWRVIIYLQCRMRQRQESRAVTGLCYFVHTVV